MLPFVASIPRTPFVRVRLSFCADHNLKVLNNPAVCPETNPFTPIPQVEPAVDPIFFYRGSWCTQKTHFEHPQQADSVDGGEHTYIPQASFPRTRLRISFVFSRNYLWKGCPCTRSPVAPQNSCQWPDRIEWNCCLCSFLGTCHGPLVSALPEAVHPIRVLQACASDSVVNLLLPRARNAVEFLVWRRCFAV